MHELLLQLFGFVPFTPTLADASHFLSCIADGLSLVRAFWEGGDRMSHTGILLTAVAMMGLCGGSQENSRAALVGYRPGGSTPPAPAI